jgi:O-methyltransferase domain
LTLRRALRLLATQGVFKEDADGKFSHTIVSRLLRADHPKSLGSFAKATFFWDPLADMEQILRTGQVAEVARGPDGFFGYLSANPAIAKEFHGAITSLSNWDIAALLKAYDFSAHRLVVDVGAGQGLLIRRILEQCPESRGIVFDLPHMTQQLVPNVTDRITIQTGDFFKDPLPTGDAYLLMNVMHDWNDENAVTILKAVARAAHAKSTILIVESVLPLTPELSPFDPQRAILTDVVMMIFGSGQERTVPQYQRLLERAGLNYHRTITTESPLSIIVGGV